MVYGYKRTGKRTGAKRTGRRYGRKMLTMSKYGRYKKNYKPLASMPIAGVATNKKLVRLRWSDNFVIPASISTPIKGGSIAGCFNTAIQLQSIVNVMYNPSNSHVPQGHVTMAAEYQNYCVKAARIKIMGQSQGGSLRPAQLGFIIQPDLNLPSTTNLRWINESPRCVWKYLSTGNGDRRPTYLSYVWKPKKYFGVSNLDDNSQLGAAVDTDPYKNAYGLVYCARCDDSSNTTDQVNGTIIIDYLVEYSNPKRITYP